jgi:hypothetical protein
VCSVVRSVEEEEGGASSSSRPPKAKSGGKKAGGKKAGGTGGKKAAKPTGELKVKKNVKSRGANASVQPGGRGFKCPSATCDLFFEVPSMRIEGSAHACDARPTRACARACADGRRGGRARRRVVRRPWQRLWRPRLRRQGMHGVPLGVR